MRIVASNATRIDLPKRLQSEPYCHNSSTAAYMYVFLVSGMRPDDKQKKKVR